MTIFEGVLSGAVTVAVYAFGVFCGIFAERRYGNKVTEITKEAEHKGTKPSVEEQLANIMNYNGGIE